MAGSLQTLVQDQLDDMTECSICTEIFTDPKSLPCLHSFCLKCLEKYGKDKKPGDQMACPICRSNFFIPDKGFCNLPNNFFIGKMVEIRKLKSTIDSQALCAICPEEEKATAKMLCFECEQNLCIRCGTSHRKIKLCQNHQVIEIGQQFHEVTFRNSYCDQHPGEIVKMYCEDDKATICFLCFAESHQTHKCLSVNKASEDLASALQKDLETVKGRLPEFKNSLEKLNKRKIDLHTQTAEVEKMILKNATKLKDLIDSHANDLIQQLASVKDTKLKKIQSAEQDAERFQAQLENYARYLDEILNKGAPGDVCREANHVMTRARELIAMPVICTGCDICWKEIAFKSSKLENFLRRKKIANVVGAVQTGFSSYRVIGHAKNVFLSLSGFK